MARDGFIVPADPQVALKKKTGVSRSWILLDCTGEGTILDVDKYAIMHRVQIHARDLRILDPLLSYPSTILGRERAIVLNLEVGFLNLVVFRFKFWNFFWLLICSDFVLISISRRLLPQRRYAVQNNWAFFFPSYFGGCRLYCCLFFG